MAPSFWQEVYFLHCTSKIFLRRGKRKKSQGALSGKYDGCSRKLSPCSFKNDVILWAL